MVYPSASASDSDNRVSLDHKRNVSYGVFSGVGRNWKRSDSSDSDSVALMISLTTSIFDFRWVISVLTTPRTAPTPTPTSSLVKTSLYFAHFHDIFPTEIEISSTTALEIQHFPFKNKVVYYR